MALDSKLHFFSEPLEQFDPMIIEHIIIGCDIIILFFALALYQLRMLLATITYNNFSRFFFFFLHSKKPADKYRWDWFSISSGDQCFQISSRYRMAAEALAVVLCVCALVCIRITRRADRGPGSLKHRT